MISPGIWKPGKGVCSWLGAACLFLTLVMGLDVYAQGKAGKPKKKPPLFSWVNPLPKLELPGIEHHTFRSPSMGCEVGYCIYLPPSYDSSAPDWRVGRLNGGDRQ